MPEETNQIVLGAVEVDTGANPSAQGGEDEGVDDHAVKVVDIVDTFDLHVGPIFYSFDLCCPSCSVCLISMLIAHSRLQEQPVFDNKQFVTFIVKRYIKNLTAKLEPEKAEEFKKDIEAATKYLRGKLKDLQL